MCDQSYRLKGFEIIAGLDEAGRGPLAGPVVAASVVLPPDYRLPGIDDSKKLSEKNRKEFYIQIQKHAVSFGIGIASEKEIDQHNILEATRLAMNRAIKNLSIEPDCLLIDAVKLPECNLYQESIIKGDSTSFSIAAASILAKVTRDSLMYEFDLKYPKYGFARHKGYGTKYHYDALHKYGPSPIHRASFLKKFNRSVHS